MRTPEAYRRTVVAISAIVCLGTGGAAQTPKDCKAAARIVQKGHPEKKEEWAWSMIVRCGPEGSAAVGAAWDAQRTTTDTVQLSETFTRLYFLKDSSLFAAGERLAVNPSASWQSRAYSVLLLMAQLFDDITVDSDRLVSSPPGSPCRLTYVADRTSALIAGLPLPADAKSRARAVAALLTSEVSTPAQVRSAGRCLASALDMEAPPES